MLTDFNSRLRHQILWFRKF